LVAGGGTMAQFSIPELGGMGQWAQGGMIMVGDMFNNALKARVDALCNELAGLLSGPAMLMRPAASAPPSQPEASLFVSGSGNWWPAELGAPATSGAQNDLRYAWFPGTRRLAIQQGGQVTVYDTGDHVIGGVSQQQGAGQSLTFTSQFGTVRLVDLPVLSPGGVRGPTPQPPAPSSAPTPATAAGQDIFAQIERLAELHQRGILTGEEFAAKKSELLNRL
jgi:hypothetical protein